MRRLRSRWTVVALVPAFFLAGFGIVSALAGGSDDPAPAAAQEQTTGADAGEGVTMVGPTTEAGATAAAPTSSAATTTAPPTTTGSNGGSNNGGANGGHPPAPPPGTIAVDYGRWEGMFEIAAPEIVPDFAMATVNGELRYFGGVDCMIRRVVVRGWFYSASGQLIGTALWESPMATGPGGEVSGREGLPFEAYGNVSELPESAALRFVKVEC